MNYSRIEFGERNAGAFSVDRERSEFGKEIVSHIRNRHHVKLIGTTVQGPIEASSLEAIDCLGLGPIETRGSSKLENCMDVHSVSARSGVEINQSLIKENVTTQGNATIANSSISGPIEARSSLIAKSCGQLGAISTQGSATVEKCPKVDSISGRSSVKIQESSVEKTVDTQGEATLINSSILGPIQARSSLIAKSCGQLGAISTQGSATIEKCPKVDSISARSSVKIQESSVESTVETQGGATLINSSILGRIQARSSVESVDCDRLGPVTSNGSVEVIGCLSLESVNTNSKVALRRVIVESNVFTKKNAIIEKTTIKGLLACASNYLVIEGSTIEALELNVPQKITTNFSSSSNFKDIIIPLLATGANFSLMIDDDQTSTLTIGNVSSCDSAQATIEQSSARVPQVLELRNTTIKNITFKGGQGEIILINSTITGKIIGGRVVDTPSREAQAASSTVCSMDVDAAIQRVIKPKSEVVSADNPVSSSVKANPAPAQFVAVTPKKLHEIFSNVKVDLASAVAMIAKANIHELNALNQDKLSLLCLAATKGLVDIVKILLGRKVSLKLADGNKNTALHLALVKGQFPCARLILGQADSEDLNALNTVGVSPLFIAAASGNVEMVELLLDRKDIRNLEQVATVYKGSFTPLTIAQKHGHMDVVVILAKKQAEIAKIRVAKEKTVKALYEALTNDQTDAAISIITEADIDHLNSPNQDGETPLHAAARKGLIDVVNALLHRKVSLKLIDGNKNTPLHIALAKSQFPCARLILEQADSEDVNALNTVGVSSLFIAAASGNLEMVQLLLDRKDIRNLEQVATVYKGSFTPLAIAQKLGHMDVVVILAKKQAEIAALKLVDKE